MHSALVAIADGFNGYPSKPPFSPDQIFPEYPFASAMTSVETNAAYAGVRTALSLLGLDGERYGSASWSPLRGIVRPGDVVVIKPNFVREFRETRPDHADCVITHGSIIRAVLDYVYLALGGRGRIVIADAPHNDADFDAIRRIAGLDEIQAFYRREAGFEVELYDLRSERARKVNGVIVGHIPLSGDPAGYVKVDLGPNSRFTEVNHLCHLLYGSEYDTREIVSHHRGGSHEYLISKTVLSADCVLSLPKLKTHKKVGLTVNLKNLVGINGNKNWLPHHREGTPTQGGDQFVDGDLKNRLERSVLTGFKRLFPLLGPLRAKMARPIKAMGTRVFGDTNTDRVRSGNWYGNDTTWRMCLDLNCILTYADSSGQIKDQPMRRFFSVVDGIVAGEGNGPLDPTPKPCGVVLVGGNPVAVDAMSARVMGFDLNRLPLIHRAFCRSTLPLTEFVLTDVVGKSNQRRFDGPIEAMEGKGLAFQPHFGWKGHIEAAHRHAGAPFADSRG